MLFQSLFGNEPSEEQFAALDIEIARAAFDELFAGEKADAVVGFLSALKVAEPNDDLKREYTRLFVGPDKLKAAPWESVYLSGDRMIFQESTLKVRNHYRSQGFIPELYPKVADDHIALELDYLAKLAERATGRDLESMQASKAFLEEHVLAWTPDYATDLEQQTGRLYPQSAMPFLSFVKRDVELLSGLLNEEDASE